MVSSIGIWTRFFELNGNSRVRRYQPPPKSQLAPPECFVSECNKCSRRWTHGDRPRPAISLWNEHHIQAGINQPDARLDLREKREDTRHGSKGSKRENERVPSALNSNELGAV